MSNEVIQLMEATKQQGLMLSERWSGMPGDAIRGYGGSKKVDFLTGIEESEINKRAMMSQLYENTFNWLRGLDESTRTLQVGSFEKFVFPILRAVYANLVAADLVTVQPLDAPTGLVFKQAA